VGMISPRRPALLRLRVMRDIIATLAVKSVSAETDTDRDYSHSERRRPEVNTIICRSAYGTYSCSILSNSQITEVRRTSKRQDSLGTYILGSWRGT
jgi:hypothetical protein